MAVENADALRVGPQIEETHARIVGAREQQVGLRRLKAQRVDSPLMSSEVLSERQNEGCKQKFEMSQYPSQKWLQCPK